MSDDLTATARKALDAAPCSDRALALEAGVPQSTLSRIRNGKLGCTPETAAALADALARWADDCREAEAALRDHLDTGGEG